MKKKQVIDAEDSDEEQPLDNPPIHPEEEYVMKRKLLKDPYYKIRHWDPAVKAAFRNMSLPPDGETTRTAMVEHHRALAAATYRREEDADWNAVFKDVVGFL